MKLVAIWGVLGALIGMVAGFIFFMATDGRVVGPRGPYAAFSDFLQWAFYHPGVAALSAAIGCGLFAWRAMAVRRFQEPH